MDTKGSMIRELGVGTYVHVYNRGVRKLPIYRQKSDLKRLLYSLYYFNHGGRMPDNWKRGLEKSGDLRDLRWPETWEKRQPLVAILAFSIKPNHFHLIIKEIVEGGTSRFMHRVSMAYSKFINEKYGESGSLFQGPFKSRVIEDDVDIRNLAVYVMVKNPFELYPGGLAEAICNFDEAYDFAGNDPLNSLGTYSGTHMSPIITQDLFGELFETPDSLKEFARESMQYRLDQLALDFK